MKYSLLTNLLSQEPDATEEYWGFSWDSLYDWYNISAAEERTLRKEFMMAQYALYHALTESFQQQQRHIIMARWTWEGPRSPDRVRLPPILHFPLVVGCPTHLRGRWGM